MKKKQLATFGLIMLSLVMMTVLLAAAATEPAALLVLAAVFAILYRMNTSPWFRVLGQVGAVATAYDSIANMRTVKFTHTAAVAPGDLIVGNGRPLISVNTTAANVEGVYIITGKCTLPRAAGLTFEIGDKVYFDPDDLNITQSQGNAILCGYCLEKSLLADTTITILLHPISIEVTDAAADSKADSASVRASTADSKAVSNSVIESTNLSVGDSKAASLSTIASANLSVGDSKAASNSVLTSTADSKAVSVSVIASSNLSTGNSKAASLSVIASTIDSKLTSHIG